MILSTKVKLIQLAALGILSGVFFGCSDPRKSTKDKAQKTEIKKPAPKKKKEEKKAFFLNNENAPKFLGEYFKKNPERDFVISTKYGEIEIRLSDKTPIHTGNFLYLVKEKQYYDSTLFYRVAEDFIIQGGDADNYLISGRKYSIGEYALPQEISPDLYHKPGAVAMCRHYDNKNDGLSVSYDFYIVIGKKVSELALQRLERENNITFTSQQRKLYKTTGGTPHLDGKHTVFGHVTSGMDVVEKISKLPTDSQDWPDENVFMKVKIKP
ncbi:peptidylprolyl isomerase [Luteibaculum oceani]|uniref:Peptidyl-prolyl cis-trans isomerase n=1 Tax=Luteibaculum oceani TaxID=1294296 RepID=A0A5C6VBQ3_9FLAO|nr:peptidylprolyl isomerase [Luteibaculum oceani]TXC82121.1 peptidylprolyl isomerase [Luteibaculum oceani]